MLFNSLVFFPFALAFFAFWRWAKVSKQTRWVYIICFSFVFYGWWDWRYVALLVLTAGVDYLAGLYMVRRPHQRNIFLAVSVVSNLGMLGFFKYCNFLIQNLNAVLRQLHVSAGIPPLDVILPVGISFYTFQSLSYTIDIYRGKLKPAESFLHFLSAVALFPHLVAGPIMRAANLLPQLAEHRKPTSDDLWQAFRLITHGYFKKMVIADNLAPIVAEAFGGQMNNLGGLDWWLITSMFAFQIYCDFSGYSDIARGLAKCMGYEFSLNFDHPYLSKSLREFWGRWHISLSSWFRDYVYIPLGGSRSSPLRGHLNMWVTMLSSGLWHGASWTFITWGALHALFLSLERITGWPGYLQGTSLKRGISTALTLAQVWIGWVFFRSENFSQAIAILGKMFDFHEWQIHVPRTALLFLGVGILREAYLWSRENVRPIASSETLILDTAAYSLLISVIIFLRGPGYAFIYFQF